MFKSQEIAQACRNRLASILPERDIVYAAHDTRISDVLSTLGEKKIMGLPVLKDGQCLGFCNLHEILGHMLQSEGKLEGTAGDFLQEIGSQQAYAIDNIPVYFGIECLAFADHHRLALMASAGKLSNICSQTDLVRFLYEEARGESAAVKAAFDAPISSLVVDAKKYGGPTSLDGKSSVAEALKKCLETGHLNLPITTDGKVSGYFSLEDLRGVTDPSVLDGEVGSFVANSPKETWAPNDPLSIGDLVFIMLKGKMHRIWLEEDGQATKAVSLTDILQHMLRFEQ